VLMRWSRRKLPPIAPGSLGPNPPLALNDQRMVGS
jgi:hypothetical protein